MVFNKKRIKIFPLSLVFEVKDDIIQEVPTWNKRS